MSGAGATAERRSIDLLSQYRDAYLRSTLELVEARMADLSKPALDAPAAFMRTALQGQLPGSQGSRAKTETPVVKPRKRHPSKTSKETVEDRERGARLDAALTSFNAADGRGAKVPCWPSSTPHSRWPKRYRRDGRPFRSTFGEWFGRRDVADARSSLV